MSYTGTYSPEDNKLRLYAATRLDAETYARVKAAGFAWAPKQGLFVAPAWTPDRADFLEELCGEIGDEDTSLAERAEERAERFDGYHAARAEDAEAARAAVAQLADGIPLGQPILVGHHSERHARRDAERIENGMRRAVKMWETSRYWEARAAGALRHAKYKERPDVRTRRIKGLEAEERKQLRTRDQAARFLKVWRTIHEPDSLRRKDGAPSTLDERAKFLANGDPGVWGLWGKLDRGEITGEQAQAEAIAGHERTIAWAERWLAHLGFRLAYERAMLAGQGGTVADRTGPEVGGAVRCWAAPRGGWCYVVKVNRVTVSVLDNWGNGGRNFQRTIPFDKLAAVMSRAEVEAARAAGDLVEFDTKQGFMLRPRPTPPEPEDPGTGEAPAAAEPEGPGLPSWEDRPQRPAGIPEVRGLDEDSRARFELLREQLRAGVKVVTAPQLFPTPAELARRMVGLACLEPGHRVLEPSAGTGALLRAIGDAHGCGVDDSGGLEVVAVELQPDLAGGLRAAFPRVDVRRDNFLACIGDLGSFDRVVMNPPFGNAQDVAHIKHALALLKPGGRLVALCANGPRQQEQLRPLVRGCGGLWEELPAGTFAGTEVRAVLLTLTDR